MGSLLVWFVVNFRLLVGDIAFRFNGNCGTIITLGMLQSYLLHSLVDALLLAYPTCLDLTWNEWMDRVVVIVGG